MIASGWYPHGADKSAATGQLGTMNQDRQLIGPVQLSMIGFSESEVPGRIRRALDDLDNQCVRLVDVLVVRKSADGMTDRLTIDLVPETQPGLISRLLDHVESQQLTSPKSVSGAYAGRGGWGRLFSGDAIANPRDVIPAASSAVLVLVEHCWATPIRDAILESRASVLTSSAWVGIDNLQELGLISPDAAKQLAGRA
jgi:hypothetical protein